MNKKANQVTDAIGEVISSSVTEFITELWDNKDSYATPSFGSFLRAESSEEGCFSYAVVYNIVTGPFDSQHKPSALGLSRQQLKTEQPHIFSLLQTQIHAAIIGYSQTGLAKTNITLTLPPKPPNVHDFVYPCTNEEVKSLTSDFAYLRLLSNVGGIPVDELLTATIRNAEACFDDNHEFLVEAGRALSHLLKDDYDRLVALLKKIRPV